MDSSSRPPLKNKARTSLSTPKPPKTSQETSDARDSPLTSRPHSSLRQVMSSENLHAANAAPTPINKTQEVPVHSPAPQSLDLPEAAPSAEKRSTSDAVAFSSISGQAHGGPTPFRSISGVKRSVGAVSTESEDEGGAIRSIQQARKKRRRSGTQYESHVIGHHIDEPLISILAKWKVSQTVMVYALKSPDLPASITDSTRWLQLVNNNSLVRVEKVVLSSIIFQVPDDELQQMSSDEKFTLIKDYVSGKQKEMVGCSDNEEEMDDRELVKYTYTPKYLAVGVDRDDPLVPIQARVYIHFSNVSPSVMFKVLPEESKDSDYDFTVSAIRNPYTIRFKSEFQRDSLEETKEEIFKRFTRHVIDPGEPLEYHTSRLYSLTKFALLEMEEIRILRRKDRYATPIVASDDDDDEPRDTIIVRRRQANESPSKTADTGIYAVETAISAMRVAEKELLKSHQDIVAQKAVLSMKQSATDTGDAAFKRKIVEHDTLKAKVKSREKNVTKREADLIVREDAMKESVICINAREEALGFLETANQRSFKKQQYDRTQSIDEREKAVEKRLVAVQEKEKLLEENDDAIAKRGDLVKQDQVANKPQSSEPMQILSSLTDGELYQLIRNNEKAKGVMTRAVKNKVVVQIDNLSKKIPDIKKFLDQQEEESKEERVDSKDTALTAPTVLATANAADTFLAPSSQFLQFVPQPLLLPHTTFGNNYELIPEGEPNAGMYKRTFTRDINHEGKRYRISRILLECTSLAEVTNPVFAIDGEKLGEVMHHNELEFDCYEKDGMRKLVQRLGKKSWFFDKARFFVSWYVYKEIVADYSI
ncbi:uncharacterized protein RAG0_00891 [Rhynchosporium agropyri]|uniref:Uncharacterized protein n=1 Tax=Rhynchosporium agropyri TaxID=914238 RepID=A0A1E1JUP0_9HELO|nr:uncharacterized protein RAG0_00891 [Rhynchosporium agropyri]